MGTSSSASSAADPTPDVLFAMTGNLYRNSRALRQVEALAETGRSVRVLHLVRRTERGLGERDLPPGVRVRDLRRPAGSGPRFFWRVHRTFREAAGGFAPRVYHASDLYVLPALADAASGTSPASTRSESEPGAREPALTFDSRELYPYVASTSGRPWVRWFWKAVQHRYLPRTDAVFTVSESIAEHLAERYAIPDPILVPNAPPRTKVEPAGRLRALAGLEEDVPVVLHQGSMQKDRGCGRLVRAAEGLEEGAIVFLGDGPERGRLEDTVRERGLRNTVRFVDRVPPHELLSVTADADAGVSLLRDTCPNHRYALPNKLFEYLMADLPVVVTDLTEMGALVREFDVGRVVPVDDTEALGEMLRGLLGDPEERGRLSGNAAKVFEVYSWERGRARMMDAFDSLLGEEHPRPDPAEPSA